MVIRSRTKKPVGSSNGTSSTADAASKENYSDKETEIPKKVIGSASDQFSFIELLSFTLILTPITTIFGVNSYLLTPRLLEPMMGNFFPQHHYFAAISAVCSMGAFLGLIFHAKVLSNSSFALGVVSTALVLSPAWIDLVTSFSMKLGPLFTTHLAYSLTVYLTALVCSWLNVSLIMNNMAFLKHADTPLHFVVLLTAQLAIVVGGVVAFAGNFLTLAHHSCYGMINTALVGAGGLFLLHFTLLRRWHTQLHWKLAVPLTVTILALTVYSQIPKCGPVNSDVSLEPEYVTLARKESITGWVTVAEEQRRRVRVMRSGHSVLGGVFIDYDESIFGSFYYMEAVTLIRRPPIAKDGDEKSPARALQIGLGIGVSARSLTEAGVLVDIVELDPVVYEFARSYFKLPLPNAIYIQDGHRFLVSQANASSYDYILHDVFTGGTVPSALFSKEALILCKKALKSNGVLALNYVGGVLAPFNASFAVIAATLKSVFSHVRVFTEEFHNPSDLSSLVNLVFFCSDFPLDFAPPIPSQMGHPQSIRAQALTELLRYEVKLDEYITPPLPPPITAANNNLLALQYSSAYEHWIKMKDLFPLEFWRNY